MAWPDIYRNVGAAAAEMDDPEPLCPVCHVLLDVCACPLCDTCAEPMREPWRCPCGAELHAEGDCQREHWEAAHERAETPEGWEPNR